MAKKKLKAELKTVTLYRMDRESLVLKTIVINLDRFVFSYSHKIYNGLVIHAYAKASWHQIGVTCDVAGYETREDAIKEAQYWIAQDMERQAELLKELIKGVAIRESEVQY